MTKPMNSWRFELMKIAIPILMILVSRKPSPLKARPPSKKWIFYSDSPLKFAPP
jgi:hypothetical protein